MKRPECPKCGRRMIIGSRTAAGRPRYYCYHRESGRKVYCHSTTNAETKAPTDRAGRRSAKTPVFKRTVGKATRRFLVTAAQNATPVHKGFLAALEQAANHLNAEILVIPLRYKNPTSAFPESQKNEEVWAPEIQPYLCNQRKHLNKNLIMLGDVKTQPTATSPLTGFEAITHGESGILGHTKLQLRTVARPQGMYPKILTTTGAVTVPNYTDSRAGKLGEFHYTLGACLAEISGKWFHLRQINASKKTGSFIDIDQFYGADAVFPAAPAHAVIFGDKHVDFVDLAVKRATFDAGGIVETLNPGVLVYHDLNDGYAVNPHHHGDAFMAVGKHLGGRGNVRGEVQRACRFVAEHGKGRQSVIVPSNHNDFLTRWIRNTDWRTDPENAAFYLETALAMVNGTRATDRGTEYPSPFEYWAKQWLPEESVRVLERDESYQIDDIELGMHGDRGPNGSRGSRTNLRRIGVKSIIGHSHSPGIDEGCYQVGTSTSLRLEYNRGPSSWLNTHCVIYANGKRSLINIIDGEWRL